VLGSLNCLAAIINSQSTHPLPVATVTSMATCVGPPDVIVKGSSGVFINFLPAARMGDPTAHGGVIVMCSPTCIIGEIDTPSPGSAGLGGIVARLAASGATGKTWPPRHPFMRRDDLKVPLRLGQNQSLEPRVQPALVAGDRVVV